jgi:cyclohexanecarboxylate-CoA ligase
MSENGAFTTTRPEDAPEKAAETDGLPLDGLEVRVVDAQDQPLPAYQEGRLQARGHASFVGYLKRPELYGTDAEGWFETGDLAHIDNEGYIRITGRSKDVIIRGGENVPVVEVEELIYGHPAVQDVAVVATPDERLGERGCAFVQLRDGESLELADLVAFLNERKIAKNYLPERLEIIPEFPRTPSGKIQKFKLREMAQELGSGGDA